MKLRNPLDWYASISKFHLPIALGSGGTRGGREENPRSDYEGSPTRVSRQRQLRGEVKSGGNQPTDIRVIHRRSKLPAARSRHAKRRGMETDRAGVDRSIHISPDSS